MIQYKASLKSEGFYNSRDNIEKRKAILLNYLVLIQWMIHHTLKKNDF